MKFLLIILLCLIGSPCLLMAQFGQGQEVFNGYFFQHELAHLPPVLKDLNGDGRADFLFSEANYINSEKALINLSLPGGGYAPAIEVPHTPSGYLRLDKDSLPDYYTFSNQTKIVLFLNLGTGFQKKDSITAETDPNYRVHFCDADGDGDDDFYQIVDREVRMWENRDTGFSTIPVKVRLNGGPAAIVYPLRTEVVQLNGFSAPEVVVIEPTSGQNPSTMWIFRRDTAAQYGLPLRYSLPIGYRATYSEQNPWMDLNGDTLPDFYDGRTGGLIQNTGYTFTPFLWSQPPVRMTVEDLNGDGMNELIASPGAEDSVGIVRVSPSGVPFYAKKILKNADGPQIGQLFHADQDGVPDFVYLFPSPGRYLTLKWSKGLASGKFQFQGRLLTLQEYPVGSNERKGQYNEALLAKDHQGNRGYVLATGSKLLFRSAGRPDIIFPAPISATGEPYFLTDAQVLDMNQDGHEDIVATCHYDTLRMWWFEIKANSPAREEGMPQTFLLGQDLVRIDYSDIDLDGDGDAVFVKRIGQASYDSVFAALNAGGTGIGRPYYTGLRVERLSAISASPPARYWVKDIDGDDRPDIQWSRQVNTRSDYAFLYARGKGNGSFHPFQAFTDSINLTGTSLFVNGGVIHDWDGDHLPDAFDGDLAGNIVFLKGKATGQPTRILIARDALGQGDFQGQVARFGICVNDFNRDDLHDVLIVPRNPGYKPRLLLSNQGGGYTSIPDPIPDIAFGRMSQEFVQSGDLNGDGYPDLIVQEGSVLRVHLNRFPQLAAIAGTAYWDRTGNCLPDSGESGLEGWPIVANPSGALALTGPDGKFLLYADTGTVSLTMQAPLAVRPLVNGLCQGGTVPMPPLAGGLNLAHADFGAGLEACHKLELSMAVSALRYCAESILGLDYRNLGTVPADSGTLTLELPNGLVLLGINRQDNTPVPFQPSGPNTFVIRLGAVQAGASERLLVTISTGCDSALLNKAVCLSATIGPATSCNLQTPLTTGVWDGSLLRIEPACTGANLVQFTVRNQGQAMADSAEYRAFRQDGLSFRGKVKLGAAGQVQLGPFAGQQPYYLLVRRSPNSPEGAFAAAPGLACGQQTMEPDFATALPLNEQAGQANQCVPIRASVDPNDKQVFPSGAGPEKRVAIAARLTYLIRFENMGSDTAFQVVVRDTLSEHLDGASFQVGALSHPFDFSVSTMEKLSPTDPLRTVVTFWSRQIRLPYTDIDSIRSHGFVSFTVRAKEGTHEAAPVENRAGIYFDVNAVVMTNTTRVLLSDSIYGPFVALHELKELGRKLRIVPNPARGSVRILGRAGSEVQIYSVLGNPVTRMKLNGEGSGSLAIGYLKPGLYLVRCGEETQRLVVER